MGKLLVGCATCVLCAIHGHALGAESGENKPLQWHIDAGYVMTNDATSDFLDDGMMLEAGVIWRPQNLPFALRADLRYLGLDVDKDLTELDGRGIGLTRFDGGDADIVGLNVGAMYNVEFGNGASAYLTAGVGPYYRDVRLKQRALFDGIGCDPFFGICFRTLTPGQIVVAEDETTRFGWSAGIGVQYPMRTGAVFLEARYLRIETKQPTELIPIQIGVRF